MRFFFALREINPLCHLTLFTLAYPPHSGDPLCVIVSSFHDQSSQGTLFFCFILSGDCFIVLFTLQGTFNYNFLFALSGDSLFLLTLIGDFAFFTLLGDYIYFIYIFLLTVSGNFLFFAYSLKGIFICILLTLIGGFVFVYAYPLRGLFLRTFSGNFLL